MRSEIISQDRNVVVVKSEYEASEVDKAVASTVKDISNKVNIKGFRRGRVPRKTLEMYIGRKAIYDEVRDGLRQKAMDEIVTEYDLQLISDPKIEMSELKEGEAFTLTFTCEVKPDVKLPDISELEAVKTVFTVSDENVDAAVKQFLEANSTLVPSDDKSDDDREIGPEDTVQVQYTSYRVTGDSKKELERDHKSVLNLPTLRKDIADAVVGHKPADEFEFDITLQDDYPDKRLAGAHIRYEMEILHYMRRDVPEETDENVARISNGVYKTTGELRAEFRRRLEESAAEQSEETLQESALDALCDAAEVDITDSLIDRQFNALRSDHEAQIKAQLDITLDEHLASVGKDVGEFDADLRKQAERMLRNTFILETLAERDDISFTSDDINEEIMKMARSMGVNPQELADYIGKDRNEFTNIAIRVRKRNTIKHLATLVKVREEAPKEPEMTGHGESHNA